MSSPAKRRKTTKQDVASSKPSRGLDFFFGKQQSKISNQPHEAKSSEPPQHNSFEIQTEPLTDEELARKLQDEWNRQSDVQDGSVQEESRVNADDATALTSEDLYHEEYISEDVVPPLDQGDAPEELLNAPDTQPQSNGHSNHTLSLQSATAAEDTITTTVPFDQSPLTFEPSRYTAQLRAQWDTEGGSATYALLTRCFVLVNATQSRIKIVDALVNLLRILVEADPSSLLPAVSCPDRTRFWLCLIDTGLAGNKLHIPAIYRSRAGTGWLCNIEGPQESLRSR